MKNLKKVLEESVEIGLILFLSGCPVAQKIEDQERFRYLTETVIQGGVIHEYDTDSDGIGDLRLNYKLVALDDTSAYLQLHSVCDDKNRDGKYTEDEIEIVNY